MKLVDRIRGFFNSHAQDFLTGSDITTNNNSTEVDQDTALKYSAVFACVRVLSETLASMPIKLYRKNKNGDKEEAREHVLYKVLHNRANEEIDAYNFKESCMMQLNLQGNSYSQIIKNRLGEVIALYPLDSESVIVERDKNTKKLIYKVREDNVEKIYKREEIFHIPGLSLNGINGLTPISYISKAIELGLSYENFGVNFYKNGCNPSGVLEHPGVLGKDALERLRKQFAKQYQGMHNTGKPIITEEGMTFKQLTVSQVDAQFIESKKYQLEDIARIYRVPLHLIQNLDRATNNNIEHQSLEFVMYTMLPHFTRWESAINSQLLTEEEMEEGYYAEFVVDALLRGDAKSRSEYYANARNWGWISVNEIRKKENMNPVENGDIYLQPLNMVEAGVEIEAEGGEDEDEEEILEYDE